MDIGLALTYVTRDPQWIKKVLIGGVIMLVSIPLSIVLVGLLGVFVVYGYGVTVTRNVIQGVENPLPEWDDFGGYLSTGFKAFIGVFVWSLPVIVLSACNQVVGSVSDSASAITLIVSLCLVLPLNLLISIFITPTIVGRFASSGELSSMFQFGDVVAQIRSTGIAPYLLFFVLSIIAGFIAMFGLIACFIGIFFTLIWALLAQAHGIGQLYRTHQDQHGAPPATPHPAF